jgi:hypothetical protein
MSEAMTKPSDFSPSEALKVKNSGSAKGSLRTRWLLRGAGAVVLALSWLVVSLNAMRQTPPPDPLRQARILKRLTQLAVEAAGSA